MRKKPYHEAMIDCGMLTSLANWLKPMDDGSLVNIDVRRAILQVHHDPTMLTHMTCCSCQMKPASACGAGVARIGQELGREARHRHGLRNAAATQVNVDFRLAHCSP